MNFIKTINLENKKDVQQLEQIDLDNTYYYWCDKLELQKLISIKEDLKYIPCYPYESINHNDLINKKLLIFFKNPKIFYGILNIQSILIKSIQEKHYFENDSDDDINNNSNNSVVINIDTYNELIKKYSIIEIPGLFFIKFDLINVFENEFGIKNFNNFINSENYIQLKLDVKNKLDEFKYPKKVLEKHIVKSYYKNFSEPIISYLNYIKKMSLQNKSIENNLDNDNISNSSSISNGGNIDQIRFKIPILWKGCEDIKNKFISQEINKKTLLFHWNNCDQCEKNDNNDKQIDWDKKIVIKNILSKNNYNIFENIINDYQCLNKFENSKFNSDFEFENNKINLIYCFNSKNIYNKCFFILEN